MNGDPETQDATESSIRTVCHTRAFHLKVASAIREVRSVEDDRGPHGVQLAAETLERVAGLEDGGDCLLVRAIFNPPASVGVTYQSLPKGLLLSTVLATGGGCSHSSARTRRTLRR